MSCLVARINRTSQYAGNAQNDHATQQETLGSAPVVLAWSHRIWRFEGVRPNLALEEADTERTRHVHTISFAEAESRDHDSTSDLLAVTSSNISRRAVDANTAELFNWFEFYGFDQHPNERNAVVSAMIGAWVGVQNALATLDKDPRNPSFLRYFQPNNVWTVQDNLRAVLAVMGMPQLEEERKCLGTIPKLQIWYGDTPAGVVDACKKPVDKQPWGFRDEYQDQSGERRDFVIFCDIYYRRYRDIRDVRCTELGTDSTPKGYGKGSTWSASMVTLHGESAQYLDMEKLTT